MEVYIVYQYGYCDGSSFMEILGLYKDIEEARKEYLNEIEENIKEYDFDYDEECKHCTISDTHNMTRLFKGGYQENWDNYLEIHIARKEIKE